MDNNNKRQTVARLKRLPQIDWDVTCTECGKKANIDILAYPTLFGKYLYLRWIEDEYELLSADYWLCSKCENEKQYRTN